MSCVMVCRFLAQVQGLVVPLPFVAPAVQPLIMPSTGIGYKSAQNTAADYIDLKADFVVAVSETAHPLLVRLLPGGYFVSEHSLWGQQ